MLGKSRTKTFLTRIEYNKNKRNSKCKNCWEFLGKWINKIGTLHVLGVDKRPRSWVYSGGEQAQAGLVLSNMACDYGITIEVNPKFC